MNIAEKQIHEVEEYLDESGRGFYNVVEVLRTEEAEWDVVRAWSYITSLGFQGEEEWYVLPPYCHVFCYPKGSVEFSDTNKVPDEVERSFVDNNRYPTYHLFRDVLSDYLAFDVMFPLEDYEEDLLDTLAELNIAVDEVKDPMVRAYCEFMATPESERNDDDHPIVKAICLSRPADATLPDDV